MSGLGASKNPARSEQDFCRSLKERRRLMIRESPRGSEGFWSTWLLARHGGGVRITRSDIGFWPRHRVRSVERKVHAIGFSATEANCLFFLAMAIWDRCAMNPREICASVRRWLRGKEVLNSGDRYESTDTPRNGNGAVMRDPGMIGNEGGQCGISEVGQNGPRDAGQNGPSGVGQNGISEVEQDRTSEVTPGGISGAGPSGRGDGGRDPSEIVILVIANDRVDKGELVKAIKQGDSGSWRVEPPVGRVQIHSRQHPFRKIVEPSPLDYIVNRSPTALGRRWISQNSLRRIVVNKHVIGVCVITTKILTANCSASIFHYESCWVDVLRIVFGDWKKGILFVVKHEGNLGNSDRKKVENFLRQHDFDPKNIIYSGFGAEVRSALERNIALAANDPRMQPSPIKISPFYLPEQLNPGKRHKIWKPERYSVWTPERVILFGRTGNGKSTLAQMLTTGRLDPDAKKFSYSSGIRGHSKDIEEGEGRGWFVVDTPGFGEPASGGTISSNEVQRMLKKFIDLINGTYAHYLYIIRNDRVDELEAVLWRFFRDLFGEELCAQFSIIVSNADEEWIQDNLDHLRASFQGCTSFIPVEFPNDEELSKDDEELLTKYPNFLEELRRENEEVQEKSLRRLETELARLARPDRPCDYGKGSKISKAIERDRAASDMKVEKSLMRRMIIEAPQLLFGLDEILSGLMHRLTVNDRIQLVPLVI